MREIEEPDRREIMFAKNAFRDLSAELRSRKEGVPVPVAVLDSIISRAAFYFDRLERWLSDAEVPTEMLAWACRQVYELDLTVRYAFANDLDLSRFMMAAAHAQNTMAEGMIAIASTPELAAELEKRVAESKRIAEERGWRLQAWPGVLDMAKGVGEEAEYRAYYRLYSQYAHPLPWIVLKPESDPSGVERAYRALFVRKAAEYGTHAFHVLDDWTRPLEEP